MQSDRLIELDLRKFIRIGLANERIKAIAQNLKTIQSIFDFVNEEIKSLPDITDIWETPMETLDKGYGDCEDLAMLLCTLLRSANYDARVFVYNMPDLGTNHAVVLSNGRWLDPTCDVCYFGEKDIPIVKFNDVDLVIYDRDRYYNL